MAEPITTTTTTTTYTAGDAVNLTHEAAIALGGYRTVEGIVEFVVTDTPPDPERGPLYHIRITTEGVPGHFGMGITRNYADEMQPATVAPPYDGEQLGIFVFNLHNSHLWVCPSSYDDPELCEGRAVSLTKAFGVEFLGTPLVRSHGMFEWYPATGASNTAALRRIVARGMAQAAGAGAASARLAALRGQGDHRSHALRVRHQRRHAGRALASEQLACVAARAQAHR